MVGLILVIIVIWILSSILQELKLIRRLLIENSLKRQEGINTSSVEEEVWEEATDICPSCGRELDPDSNICPHCGLEFKED